MVVIGCCDVFFFFFKQKTAYDMRISDWTSDVCSSDLASRLLTKVDILARVAELRREQGIVYRVEADSLLDKLEAVYHTAMAEQHYGAAVKAVAAQARIAGYWQLQRAPELPSMAALSMMGAAAANACAYRSEEHTSELQSLMRHSYAVFCLKQKK